MLLYVFSEWIAIHVLDVKDTALVLRVLAPAIVFVSASSVIRGYFGGLRRYEVYKCFTNIRTTFKLYINNNTCIYGSSVVSHMLWQQHGNVATTISVVLSFIYMYVYYKKHKLIIYRREKSREDKKPTRYIIRKILKLSVPVTIGSLISIVHTMIDTITVTNGIQKAYMHIYTAKDVLESKATEMKGILSKVSTIVGLPQSITIAIAIAIVPVVSVLVARGEKQKAKERIERAINLSVIIIMPAIVGLFVLSEPLLKLMYPKASEGGVLMQILCVATVFMCLSHTIRKWTSRYPVML